MLGLGALADSVKSADLRDRLSAALCPARGSLSWGGGAAGGRDACGGGV